MPDSTRPDGSPLPESDADRLSERFTASWEAEPEVPDPGPLLGAPSPEVQQLAPSAPVARPKKHTLLGMAPIVIHPAATAAQPLEAQPEAVTTSPAASQGEPPAPPSASEIGPITQAVTTPSKPYVPKDDPSTPAVVIADSALPPISQTKPDRARMAQTITTRIRSSPIAAPAPVQLPFVPEATDAPDSYPSLRPRSKMPLIIGIVGTAALAVVGLAALTAGPTDAPTAAPATSQLSDPGTTKPLPTAVTPAQAVPYPVEDAVAPAIPTSTTPTPTTPAPAAPALATPPQQKDESKSPRATRAKSKAALPPPRSPADRSAGRAESKQEPRPSPAAQPAAKPAPKSDIVRETPF